jgi:hypothetical protein
MSSDAHLTTGHEPGVPADDTIERASVLATAERVAHCSTAMGQPVSRTDDFVAADTGQPEPMTNWAVLLRPVVDPGDPVLDRITEAFAPGRPHLLVSAWPTPDLRARGLLPVGHPPFMVRPVGPPATIPPVEGFEVTEVVDADGIAVMERVLIEGYPLPSLLPVEPGRSFDARVLGGPFRAFVGWLDGAPVTTASTTVAHGVSLVEFVATVAEGRGRGLGALVTQAAALADPSVPAVLVSSDLGRSVYERLGFLPVTRWTLWMRP